MLYLRVHRAIAFWLLLCSVTLAQTPPVGTSASAEQRKKTQELKERQALTLLDEALREVTALRLPENRIRIQAVAADLLWKRDEKRARSLYREVVSGLSEIFSNTSRSEIESDGNLEAGVIAYNAFSQLRFKILFKVAEHDAKLAQELLVASRPLAPGEDSAIASFDAQEREFELRIATKLAETDPQLAYQMAEEKLGKSIQGDIGEALEILQKLVDKDPALASKLARSIFGKMQSETAENNSGQSYVLARLITILTTKNPAIKNSSDQKDGKPKTTGVDEAVLREALDALASQALAMPTETNSRRPQLSRPRLEALSVLQRLMPLVEKYIPARLPALREKISEMEKSMPPGQKTFREIDELMQKGDTDGVLAAATKLPQGESQDLYLQVAQEAIRKGEIEKARQILEKLPKESPLRKNLQAQIEQASLQTALDKGKLDEVRSLLNKTRSVSERVSILTRMAGVEAAKGNQKEVKRLLNEASGLVSHRAANRMQLESQLLIAAGYAAVDPAHSFEILESAAARINELIAAAASLEGFIEVTPFRDGEMLMPDEDSNSLFSLLQMHAASLSLLLATDFDRVKSVVSQFQRPEAKASVRIALVESVLGEHPEGEGFRDLEQPAYRAVVR